MMQPVHGHTAVLQHVALNAAQNLKALPSIQITMTYTLLEIDMASGKCWDSHPG